METTQYAASAILDTWINHDWSDGVQLRGLADLTELVVRTRNTVYELTLIDSASREVLIRGGKFFPERTPARLAGSSLGGSFLKVGGIYTGFGMEVVAGGQTIVTSPVQSITLYPPHS
jgi:hypothetical protein